MKRLCEYFLQFCDKMFKFRNEMLKFRNEMFKFRDEILYKKFKLGVIIVSFLFILILEIDFSRCV